MTQTIRLALVMNGGISLAVWMGGVAKELDLAVRASRGEPAGIADADLVQFDAWKERLAGRRLEIDIVAGTSAGGLNGTILATSYGLGAPLPDLKEMWRTSAAMEPGALLPTATETSSVLSGSFFASEVRRVLGSMRVAKQSGREVPVTLFVTGTALGDHRRAYQDSFQQDFDSPDHRRVYRFRSRPPSPSPSSNEFEASFDALAIAARASAGFPMAFAPMRESDELLERALGPHDGRSWLMDGGVLDNAPFGPVLDEIVSRPVDTDVRRILVYVVPSDGGARRQPTSTKKDAAPSWFGVLRSAIDFPGEADFRDDLEELTEIFATADARRGAAVSALSVTLNPAVREDVGAALRAGSAFLRAQYFAEQPRYDAAALLERVQGRTGQVVRLAPVMGTVPIAETSRGLGAFGQSATERMVRTLIGDLRDRLRERPDDDDLRKGAAGVSAALGELVQWREGIEDSVAREARRTEAPDVVELVATAVAEQADARAQLVTRAIQDYATAVGASAAVVEDAVTAVEIVTQALAPQVRSAPPPFELLRLGPDNVSPLAPHAVEVGDRKLYGTRLGHFGAFGREEWRAWDWGWGRLDAAAHLGRALALENDDIRELQQGIWAVEGNGEDLEEATRHVGGMSDDEIRGRFGRVTVDGLLESASRMLKAKADLPALVQTIAPRVGRTVQTGWNISPLWLVPGIVVRRKVRGFFRAPASGSGRARARG